MHGFPFGFQPIEAPSIIFHYYLYFSLMLFLFLFFPLLFTPSFFPRYGYKRGFGCVYLLPYPPSIYLPRHFRDQWLHQNNMNFEVYTEFMGHIKETIIQWVIKWWHISSSVHSCCKDYYVPLVGLCCCS